MGGNYEDLEVWQAAMDLAVQIYAASKCFPADERYGLTNQLRRAAISVASNIAEGKGKISDKELLQFLGHARGSLCELQTQIRLAGLLAYVDGSKASDLTQRANRVGCLLNGLMRSIGGEHKVPG